MKERGWLKSKRARSWLPARNDDRFPTSCGEGTSSTCLLGLSLPCYTTRATRSTLCVYVTRCFEACGLLWPRAANYVLTVNASVNRLTIRLKLSGIFYDFFSSFSLSLSVEFLERLKTTADAARNSSNNAATWNFTNVPGDSDDTFS